MKLEKKPHLAVFNSPNKPGQESQKLSSVLYSEEFLKQVENLEADRGKFGDFLQRRGILILGVAVAVTTAVFSWTLTQRNEYEGKFQLLVEQPVTENTLAKIYSGELKLEPGASANQENLALDFDSQLQVLQSPKVMSSILKQVQTRYPEVNYTSLFGNKTGAMPFSADRLSVQRVKDTKIIEVKYRDFDPKKIKFVLDKVAEGYLKYSVQDGKTDIRKSLDFIQSQLPALTKRTNSTQAELQKLRQQYNFIDPQVQTQILAQQLSQLQAQKLEAQAQLNQQQLLYTTLQAQLGLDQKQALMASALSQAPRYQALLNQLQDLEAKTAINSATYTEQSPQIQSLQEQRKNLIPLLRQEAEQVLGTDLAKVNPQVLAFQDSVRIKLIEQLVDTTNQIQVLGVRDRVLGQAIQQFNQYSQGFPIVLRRYSDLQRDLEMTTNSLNNLLAKQQALQLEAVGAKQMSWQLIAQPGIPQYATGEPIPASPNLPLNLAVGGMAGLLLGGLVAKMTDRLTNTKVFHSPEEVKHTVRLPLLGVIPASTKILRLPASQATAVDVSMPPAPTDAFQEAFRSLNVNIRLVNTDSPVRSCAITSCQVADGKSTVAVHLAQAAAAMGQRVLLVDADLRRPQVHEMLRVPNWKGLSSVIAKDVEIHEAIVRSPQDENLFILPSGPFFPDPTKLLASSKMQHLMENLPSLFDLVIYDTPPLLGLADANLLATHTNGLILVVGLNQTEREALLLALEDLKMAGVPLLGMVANGDKGSRYSSYTSAYLAEQQPA